MDLAAGILDYSGSEGQQVADIAIGGVRDVDDFGDIHCLLVGDLLGVNAGCGCFHVDFLLQDFFVREDEAEGLLLGIDVGCGVLVEARLFDADLIGLGLARRPGAASGVVGDDANRGLAWLFNGDLGGGDGEAVLVDDGEDDGVWICGGGGGASGGAKALRWRCRDTADGEQNGNFVHSTLETWHETQFKQIVGCRIKWNTLLDIAYVMDGSCGAHQVDRVFVFGIRRQTLSLDRGHDKLSLN